MDGRTDGRSRRTDGRTGPDGTDRTDRPTDRTVPDGRTGPNGTERTNGTGTNRTGRERNGNGTGTDRTGTGKAEREKEKGKGERGKGTRKRETGKGNRKREQGTRGKRIREEKTEPRVPQMVQGQEYLRAETTRCHYCSNISQQGGDLHNQNPKAHRNTSELTGRDKGNTKGPGVLKRPMFRKRAEKHGSVLHPYEPR